MLRRAWVVAMLLTCSSWSHAETVSFVVSHITADKPQPLVLALFKPSSELFDKRFKRPERADIFCRTEISGKHEEETISCDLPPSKYIGIAYIDSDRNGELTHGTFGPIEQFGLTGIEEGVSFPPAAERTVIDTSTQHSFKIVLK
ncbi:MAG: hypothetical protein JWN23_2394 [Rhodocyclales bacterium]|nr:hypothetical protein [Rhodocyclales bacterium]